MCGFTKRVITESKGGKNNIEMAEVAADKILKTLGIDKPMVAGMFLVGSNLWGTARKDSDWDVVVIMKNDFKKMGPTCHSTTSTGERAVVNIRDA